MTLTTLRPPAFGIGILQEVIGNRVGYRHRHHGKGHHRHANPAKDRERQIPEASETALQGL